MHLNEHSTMLNPPDLCWSSYYRRSSNILLPHFPQRVVFLPKQLIPSGIDSLPFL